MYVGNQTEVLDDFNPEALNVTFETNLTAGNLSTLSKGMIVGFFVLFEILANPISFGISLFEKYGVDSQRRTAINMLYSKVAIANVFKNTLALPFAIFGYIINPEGLNGWLVGAGTKIEFLTDQGETLRNEYFSCKNFKTGFGSFVPRTVFSSHSGPASL